jgi:hypothetical protein
MKSTGFGSIIPSFVPVFAGAFERVQQLSISLESRAFGSTGAKTSFRRIAFGPFDKLVALLGVLAGIAGTVIGLMYWSAGSTAVIILPVWLTVTIFLLASVMFVGVLLVAVVALARS